MINGMQVVTAPEEIDVTIAEHLPAVLWMVRSLGGRQPPSALVSSWVAFCFSQGTRKMTGLAPGGSRHAGSVVSGCSVG